MLNKKTKIIRSLVDIIIVTIAPARCRNRNKVLKTEKPGRIQRVDTNCG